MIAPLATFALAIETVIGTVYNVYVALSAVILLLGVAVLPVWRPLVPQRERVAVPMAFQRLVCRFVLALGALGFLLWPYAWWHHFQHVHFVRFTSGGVLMAGFILPAAVMVIGLVYRPMRKYTRGRYAERPPDDG